MRKLSLSLLLAIFASLSGCTNYNEEKVSAPEPLTRSTEASEYYYYFDEKIYVDPNPEQLYVIFEEDKLISLRISNPAARTLNIEADLGQIDYRLQNVHLKTSASAIGHKKLMAGTFKVSEINSLIEDYQNVYYQMPCYKSKQGRDMVFSNVFYVYLKNENDISILEQLATEYSVDILRNNLFNPLMWLLACNPASAGNSLEMANAFYETGLFETAEPDCISFEQHQVYDPLWSSQWNLQIMELDWTNLQATGEGIIVAVSDRGVQPDHPDLPNVIHSYDTTNDSSTNTNIYNAHGTQVAGIIGAAIFNGKGIMGIAPDVGILSLNVNGANWSLMGEEYANSIWYATDYGADVINCSWGWEPSTQITLAINHAVQNGRNGKGCVVVVSSGNSAESILGEPYLSFPASLENTIAVGAMYQPYLRCPFSQYGQGLDVIAPGLNVPTTNLQGWNHPEYGTGDYVMKFSGTSASAPHVSAAAALILSVNPELTYSAVKQIICETAKKIDNYSFKSTHAKPYGTWNNEVGYGLLDIKGAVNRATNVINNHITIEKGEISIENIKSIEKTGGAGVWLLSNYIIPVKLKLDYPVESDINIVLNDGTRIEIKAMERDSGFIDVVIECANKIVGIDTNPYRSLYITEFNTPEDSWNYIKPGKYLFCKLWSIENGINATWGLLPGETCMTAEECLLWQASYGVEFMDE